MEMMQLFTIKCVIKLIQKIKANHQMLFCTWTNSSVFKYKVLISIPNTKGELAKVFNYLSKMIFIF